MKATGAAAILLAAVACLCVADAYHIDLDVSESSIDGFADANPKRQLVGSTKELLSILTPVYPDAHTLGLLRNQLRTFAAFADIGSFSTWIMVVPHAKAPAMETFLKAELPQLPPPLGDKIRVVSDESCAPELEEKRLEALALAEAQFVLGWQKQQLLKLACAHLVPTPFYLITDADTFYLNTFSAEDLFDTAGCSATTHITCDSRRTQSYRAKTEEQPYVSGAQGLWIRNSAATLQVEPPTGVDMSIGVTPQIMSRAMVASMAAHLDTLLAHEVWERVTWRAYLVKKLTEYFARPKAEQSQSNTPWTEYNLYWCFAQHAGLWDRYHKEEVLQSVNTSVWHANEFEAWDPCKQRAVWKRNPHGFWATVQSVADIPGEQIWTKLEPCVSIKGVDKAAA